MSAAFTPGPWKFNGGVQTMDGAYVCDLSSPRGAAERDAAGHLIAAAPELYEVCEALDDFILSELAGEQPTMDFCQANPEAGDLLLRARAALAKARGEQ